MKNLEFLQLMLKKYELRNRPLQWNNVTSKWSGSKQEDHLTQIKESDQFWNRTDTFPLTNSC